MTHLLDRTVLFNNHGRRDGTGAEFYARGIFENSYNPERILISISTLYMMRVIRMDFTIKHLIDLKRQKICNLT